MSPQPRLRSGVPRRLVAAAIGAMLLLAACGSDFDPSGPCTSDGKVAGAYPEMEALVPKAYNGVSPAELDSGRTCTADGLGSLAGHGIKELRFAGGTWTTGTQSGLTLATFTSVGGGPDLDPAWLSEFYETTARSAKNIQSIETSEPALGDGATAHRLDVLNDESYQTVIVWRQGGRVVAVLVGDFIREVQSKDAHEKIVQAAVQTLLGGAPA
ncbi:MAG TPA: hypothetical protein VFI34_13105 [Candidatus Limnocylindrales bacterium]|nr:hypothetical protein [Candidatus Limnocylindrales bacterium]